MIDILFSELKKEYTCIFETYKQVPYDNLRLLRVSPKNRVKNNTAIVFVHGGGWTIGCPNMYIQEMHYFAERGAECFSIQYRLAKEKDNTIVDCIKDVRSAIRHIRKNAERYMILPDKIVVVGDSAGAHLLLSTITFDKFDDEKDDVNIDVHPNVIINCNGVVDLTKGFKKNCITSEHDDIESDDFEQWVKSISPLFNVKKVDCKILNLQGKADGCVNYQDTIDFHNKQLKIGNDSELVLWDDAKHAFILIGYTGTNAQICRAILEIDNYLIKKGYLNEQNINLIVD